jgi:large subunit ribosomal protein L10e
MALRKASAYSKRAVTPFTRVSKRRQKSFIKVVPPQKIVKFTMGNTDLFNQGKLSHHLNIVSLDKVQIRHNALEACRQYINKELDTELSGQYIFKVVPFPHQIQRENKMLTGAGADRMQTGMQLSFGKSMGKAAIVQKNGRIFFIAVQTPKAVQFSRETIRKVKSKLPCKVRVLYEFKEGSA